MSHRKRGVDRRQFLGDIPFPITRPSEGAILTDRRSGIDRRRLGQVAAQPLFRGIPFSVVEEVYPACERRQLEPGEQLLAPGVANDCLFLLLEGQLTVHIDSPESSDQIFVGAGECVGDISIIDHGAVTAYVIARRASVLLAIPEVALWDEVVRHPGVARNLMRQLAERFRARNELMQRAIKEHLRYEALQKELAIAAEIQSSMLPQDFLLDSHLDIDASMSPARHIGGDFFDLFRIDADKVCCAVGDVAGKGVPAALFVVRAMTILRTEMLKQQPAERAVAALNRALCQGNESCMFVTLAVVVVDTRDGHCRYVSAGHNPAAYARLGQGFDYLVPLGGILTGIDEGAVYDGADLHLDVGDTLLLYTDGVTEAMNPQKELFGEARLLDCLNRNPDRQASELTGRIGAEVHAFADGAPQADDLTMVAVRRIN